MTRIVSDAVRAVGYDPARRVLRVQFRSGDTYDYSDVEPDLYARMLQPHPWREVGQQVLHHRFRQHYD
jgi:hypothetical protein